jgi:glycosyltransferase involved in cell wall biosynthesis
MAHHDAGLALGLAANRCFLVPYGINGARLNGSQLPTREELRNNYSIPADAFVVLSLAAVNRSHKRIDWLIREFANTAFGHKAFLLLAGNRESETESLEALARELLPPDTYRFVQVPYADVPGLLRLSNVLVQCSLDEGFGRVLAEAMGASLPLLLHPHATGRWIVNNSDCYVDMTAQGALASRLSTLSNDKAMCESIAGQNARCFQRFEWATVANDYLKMYEAVRALDARNKG